MNSTPRERMIAALERRPPLPGPVPHWELVFFPTMEAFGKVSSVHRNYSQWLQMSERERELHRIDIAELAIAIAEKYEHNAISVLPAPWESQEFCRLAEKIRERSGDRYLLIAHADGTQAIPSGGDMEQFSYRLIDEPQKLKDESMRAIEQLLRDAVSWRAAGIEAVAMCSDYCMNAGPFLSPELFAEFVTPFLKLQVAELRKLGFYTIKHTDGNIMPIIDQLAGCVAQPGPAGRSRYRRSQKTLRRPALPDRQRQLRPDGYRDGRRSRGLRRIRAAARHAGRRVRIQHQQLYLHGNAAGALRADPENPP